MTEPAVRQRRQRRRVLTDKMVAELPRERTPYFEPDVELPKHGIRVRPSGPSAYTVICRDPYGKQRWVKVGSTAEMKIAEAREVARAVIKRVEAGEAPFPPPPVKPESVESIASNWLARHVRKNGLRTADEIERSIRKYVLPHWGPRNFVDIRRRDIAALLDHVEDRHGAHMADAVLTVLRSMAGWYVDQGRADDDYISPFREISQRVPKAKRKRSRVLDDDELRRVWRAACDVGPFGAFLKLALLTAQRYAKVVDMRWDDVDPKTGVWSIPTAPGEKNNAGKLQLPAVAIEIVNSQPKFANNPYVLANNRSFNSRRKHEFDAACGVTGWRVHDLRRTARSLMSRAGVLSEHAERVLGHSLGAIQSIYDRHDYAPEKADAVKRLAALIETIVNPPAGDNVVVLHEAAVS